MYHLHITRVTRLSKQGALDRFSYIARMGKYKKRGDVVRALHSLHLPAWVDRQRAEEFWMQADSAAMRANGRILFSIDIAIPRILPVGQQNALVEGFVEALSELSTGRKSSERLTATYAIHEGIRKDDHVTGRLPNPHMHILLSPSVVDGFSRSKEVWFKRADSRRKGTSGSPRSIYIGTRRWLMEVRKTWADHANRALQEAGLSLRLDHRSHADRGLLLKPTVHVGPRGMYLAEMGILSEKLQRNLRFQEFNATLMKQQAAHIEFQAKVALRRRTLEAQEDALRQSLFIATREMETELASHPLAAPIQDLSTASSVIVFPAGWPESMMGSHALGLSVIAETMMSILGTQWTPVRCCNRYFFISSVDDSVIALDSALIATDAKGQAAITNFADLLSRMQPGKLRVFAQSAVYERVGSAFGAAGVDASVSKIGMRSKQLLSKRMA